tara:strand:- start:2850 stop:3728 length:879 start_codon:yes stop_codon:yes gene_type:complete
VKEMSQKNTMIHSLFYFFLFSFSFLLGQDNNNWLNIKLRERILIDKNQNKFQLNEKEVNWDLNKTAIIIIDMWDNHHCKSAARRVAEMAPYMNQVLKTARSKGVFIIHAPSDCMEYYKTTTQRKRAEKSPFINANINFEWNSFNPKKEGYLSSELEKEGCSCDTPEPCGPSYKAWSRQIETIDIYGTDAISDDGQEIYNLLEERKIDNVIIMGVHTNRCVLGRPFGIRQMNYTDRNVVLCRDLTDSYHRDPGKHFAGLKLIIQHIEKYWCPTITSASITKAPPFIFKEQDRR